MDCSFEIYSVKIVEYCPKDITINVHNVFTELDSIFDL